MMGTEKQIAWASDLIARIEQGKEAASARWPNQGADTLLQRVADCCKRPEVYAGDVIEAFGLLITEAAEPYTVLVGIRGMRGCPFKDDLIDAVASVFGPEKTELLKLKRR